MSTSMLVGTFQRGPYHEFTTVPVIWNPVTFVGTCKTSVRCRYVALLMLKMSMKVSLSTSGNLQLPTCRPTLSYNPMLFGEALVMTVEESEVYSAEDE
jgi:hypothetical protein